MADVEMQIVPLIVGDERAAMRLCQEALERGVFAQAIRPPTVAAGSSRLRLTAMASHTASELEMAARAFGDAARGGGDRAGVAACAAARTPGGGRGSRELAYAELTASARVRSDAGAPVGPDTEPFTPVALPNAPFDVERELDSVRAA